VVTVYPGVIYGPGRVSTANLLVKMVRPWVTLDTPLERPWVTPWYAPGELLGTPLVDPLVRPWYASPEISVCFAHALAVCAPGNLHLGPGKVSAASMLARMP